jgi:hypothetical protein
VFQNDGELDMMVETEPMTALILFKNVIEQTFAKHHERIEREKTLKKLTKISNSVED